MPNLWFKYLEYLKEWADSHRELAHCGSCPASYQEFLSNEAQELDDLYVE